MTNLNKTQGLKWQFTHLCKMTKKPNLYVKTQIHKFGKNTNNRKQINIRTSTYRPSR
ncbi:hypothetical protein Hanom_Chr05g00463571 [Helianthus anomalus]